jgi:hypothetical protein
VEDDMRRIFSLLLVLACCISACKPNFDADIDAIKKSAVPTNLLVSAFFAEVPNTGANTIDAGITQLAGVAGSVKWEAYRAEKYKDNPDVVCVAVEVKSVSDKGNHTFKFQWLLNRKSTQNELISFDVDGKKQSPIDAIMALRFGVVSQDGNETIQPKADEPPKATLSTKSRVINCKDIQYGDSNYSDNMDLLAKKADLSSWSKYTEEFVSSLCKGNKSSADNVVMYGGIQSDEALRIAKALGVSYAPPQRDTKSLLFEMTNNKLSDFMCSACASNAASYFVENPNSDLGKLIKKALDGDKSARAKLNNMDWSSGPPKGK